MTPSGPLQGVRVLELGSTVAGPFCGRLFADFGADVVKVETPSGDPLRTIGRHFEGKSLWWASMHRNKEPIAINLKSEQGRDIISRLMPRYDEGVENFKPCADQWFRADRALQRARRLWHHWREHERYPFNYR